MVFSWKKLAVLAGLTLTGIVFYDIAKVLIRTFIVFESEESFLKFKEEADQRDPQSTGTINTPNMLLVNKSNVLDALPHDEYGYGEAGILEKLMIWWDKRAPARFSSYSGQEQI